MAIGERADVSRLVAAAQAGGGAAFEALVARFRPTALLVARQACGDAELAEDAVQDAFLTAFRAIGNLEDPSLFGPWFATIVRNRARRLAGDGDRVRCVPLDRDGPSVSMPPPPGPSEEATRGLPEGIRESMLLFYFEGWTVGEIAALLQRPVTTVKWQLHAGRALLRRRLGAPEESP